MSSVRYNWGISDAIKVTEFRDNWKELFKECQREWGDLAVHAPREEMPMEDDLNSEFSLDFMRSCIPKILLKELEFKCSFHTLTCKEETAEYEFACVRLAQAGRILPQVPKDHDLVTLTLQENELKKRWSDSKYKQNVKRRMKYLNAERLLGSHNDEDDVEVTVAPDEVILSVIVCIPSKSYAKYNIRRGGSKFLVLGSQKLTELRDAILCIADVQPTGDFSSNPRTSNFDVAKDVYKSGFFFINGTFYNDMRHPDCTDISKVIRDWIRANPATQNKFGSCSTELMENTTFNDLEIKQGYGYLYMHQGKCEHFIMFNDLRFINASDSKDRSHYPLCYSFKKKRGLKCMLCYVYPPKWVTTNHHRVHADPFLFCDGCFYSFNYDSDGQKIGEFEAHPYVYI